MGNKFNFVAASTARRIVMVVALVAQCANGNGRAEGQSINNPDYTPDEPDGDEASGANDPVSRNEVDYRNQG